MNKIKNWFTPKRIIGILITIIILIFLSKLDSCRNEKFKDQQIATLSQTNLKLVLENQKLIQDTNKLGQTVSKQEVILTSNQGDIKKITEDYFNLKKADDRRIKQVNALLQERTSTGVKNIDVEYEDEEWVDSPADTALVGIPCDSLSYVRVPRKASIDSQYFKFSATIEKTGLHIDSINFPDSQRIAIIETGGLLKKDINGKLKLYSKPKMEIQVMHTNPNIQTLGLSSLVYKPKAKGRWLERIAIAAVTVFLTIKLTK